MNFVERCRDWLALNQNAYFIVNLYRIVNLFALLTNRVGAEFRDHLGGIEDVVIESRKKGQNDSCL